jgi:hypothetical protein
MQNAQSQRSGHFFLRQIGAGILSRVFMNW